jgi:glycosyltransferase involved in cell wall biosynthesis
VISPLFYRGGAPDALAGGTPAAIADAARFSLALLGRVHRDLGGCDALISHWVLPCGVACALCQGGRPHLAIAHSSDVHLARRLGLAPLLRWVSSRARLVYTDASLCLPGAPGQVVPMGIDAAALAIGDGADRKAERLAARGRLGLDRERRLVLFLGRLVPVKGVGVLLAAMQEGPPPGFELLIAGDGPLREELLRQAAPLAGRVRFLGEVQADRKRDVLLASDLLVLPSLVLPDGRTEGAPTVVMEALCAGLPVVSSDVGGVRALAGDAAVLVPPGDGPALLRALGRALAPAWLEPARERARLRGAQFDWSVIAPRLLGSLLSG